MPRKKKRMKRANKEGSVVLLKGNRRKPYAVRVTLGRDDNGRLNRKDIGYFESEDEANDFLAMYNLMKKKNKKSRLQISDDQARYIDENLYTMVKEITEIPMLTFKEIFDILYNEQYQYQKNCKSIKSWFKKFKDIHNFKINAITLYDLQEIFDKVKESGLRNGTLSHMKCVAMDIFRYAVKHQYIKRDDDYTEFIDISLKGYETETDNKKENNTERRKSFSVDQVRNIINHNTLESKFTLIYILTGCRPIELLEIDTKNIYIDVKCKDDGIERNVSYMITGSKTDAGLNRIIPIHDTIKPIIIELLNEHPNYLIIEPCPSIVNVYQKKFFTPLMDKLNYDKVPYACRHTFTSLAKLYNVDPFARKRIVGHKSNDLTDDVYTDVFINKLYKEINKIKV